MARQKQSSRRDAVFFTRVQRHNKQWLFDQMKREGYESMSLWFDELIVKMKAHIKKGFSQTALGQEAQVAKKRGLN